MNERDIAMGNDNRIIEMATYWESRGMVRKPEVELILERFTEFKGLVRRGSFTLEQLETHVFGQFGIMEEKTKETKIDEMKLILKELEQASIDLRIKKQNKP